MCSGASSPLVIVRPPCRNSLGAAVRGRDDMDLSSAPVGEPAHDTTSGQTGHYLNISTGSALHYPCGGSWRQRR